MEIALQKAGWKFSTMDGKLTYSFNFIETLEINDLRIYLTFIYLTQSSNTTYQVLVLKKWIQKCDVL